MERNPRDSDSDNNGGKGKAAWSSDRVLSIGKKLAITGCVISSAPVILPALVVISALAFAASAPFGFAYASYACAEKLMSKLLPARAIVPPSLMMKGFDDQYLTPYESEEDIAEGEEESKSPSFEIGSESHETESVESAANRESEGRNGTETPPETASGAKSEPAREKDGANGGTIESEIAKSEEISGVNQTGQDEKQQPAPSSKEKESGKRGKKKAFTKLHFLGKKKEPAVEHTTVETSTGDDGKSPKESDETREEASSEVVAEEKARHGQEEAAAGESQQQESAKRGLSSNAQSKINEPIQGKAKDRSRNG